MKFSRERTSNILGRLGGDLGSDVPMLVCALAESVDVRHGWSQYAREVAGEMERGSWRERLTAPESCVADHTDALREICEPFGIVIESQVQPNAFDVVLSTPAEFDDSTKEALIGWLTAELSNSTVASQGIQTAVGIRRDEAAVRLRAVPPPRPPFWLALLGRSGSAATSEFMRHHQLLLTTNEEIGVVGALADEAEQHLAGVLDTLDEGFLHVDHDRGSFFVSDRLKRLVTIEANDLEEFIDVWRGRTPVEQYEATCDGLEALRRSVPGVYSLAIVDEGSTRVFEMVVYESQAGVSASFSDDTEAFSAKRRSAIRKMTLDSLLTAAPFAIAVHRDDEILFANEMYESDLGKVLHAPTSRTVKVSRQGTSILPISELEIVQESGVVRSFEQNTSVVEWDDGGAFLTVFRETTEERAFLARSFELDRVVALGTLADGVAHEINNPLAYVQSNIEFARESLRRLESPVGNELLEALADAHDGAKRVSELVAEFRQAAPGDHAEEGESVDLTDVLEAARSIANATVRERATVSTSLDIPGPVKGQSARLVQVFINLLVNAAQAIPDGRRGQIRLVAESYSPGTVCVEVRDNGDGIPPELLESVFKPFFTTKPPGQGTGLGLSICRNIVEQFGGRLELESEVGVGTTVSVELPIAERETDTPNSFASIVSDAYDEEVRVLVVDDDPQILRMVERVLRRSCEVVTTRSADDALALARTGRFELILTDVYMPGMTGPELYDRLIAARPEYKGRVWMMTGGRSWPSRDSDLPTLQKPFGIDTLKRIVREASSLEAA